MQDQTRRGAYLAELRKQQVHDQPQDQQLQDGAAVEPDHLRRRAVAVGAAPHDLLTEAVEHAGTAAQGAAAGAGQHRGLQERHTVRDRRGAQTVDRGGDHSGGVHPRGQRDHQLDDVTGPLVGRGVVGGEAQVHQVDVVPADEHVRGAQVAVCDAGPVQATHLVPRVAHGGGRDRSDDGVQRGGVDELLHQDGVPAGHRGGRDDRRDPHAPALGQQGHAGFVFALLAGAEIRGRVGHVPVPRPAVELVGPVRVALLAAGHLDEQLPPAGGDRPPRLRTPGVTVDRRQPCHVDPAPPQRRPQGGHRPLRPDLADHEPRHADREPADEEPAEHVDRQVRPDVDPGPGHQGDRHPGRPAPPGAPGPRRDERQGGGDRDVSRGVSVPPGDRLPQDHIGEQRRRPLPGDRGLGGDREPVRQVPGQQQAPRRADPAGQDGRGGGDEHRRVGAELHDQDQDRSQPGGKVVEEGEQVPFPGRHPAAPDGRAQRCQQTGRGGQADQQGGRRAMRTRCHRSSAAPQSAQMPAVDPNPTDRRPGGCSGSPPVNPLGATIRWWWTRRWRRSSGCRRSSS